MINKWNWSGIGQGFVRAAAAGVITVLFSLPAHALVITDLFNTGVDASGTPLGASVDDPHYALISQPAPGGLVDATTPADGFPIPPWIANDANSRWIGPNTSDANGPVGTYIYETTFTLPTLTDLASVLINGRWATDNPGTNIFINGISTGQTASGFTSYTSFAITSGFQVGSNTLRFELVNLGGPTGLRVDDMVGNFSLTAVDEPHALFLVGLGLVGMIARRRRHLG